MAVAKVSLSEPLQPAELDVTHSALVIGGGLAGMTAALAVADQGFDVTLVERTRSLGGNLRKLRSTLTEADVPAYLSRVVERVRRHPRIQVLTRSRLEAVSGFVGNFESTVRTPDGERKVKHGAIIVANGGTESKPSEYGYGRDPRVMTQIEFEELLAGNGETPPMRSVVMIQCVGSREADHLYCSRVCCATAVKNAIRLKERSPSTEVAILYRDIRTYGFYEEFYRKARELGVLFVRFDLPNKPAVRDGSELAVTVREPVVGRDVTFHPDRLVLSCRIDPDRENEALSQLLKVPTNADDFFLEAHVKLRPVEFATEGIFVAGLAHGPKSIPETVAQAEAAAAKAVSIIWRDKFEAEPTIAALNEDLCDGCGICVPVCEYNALEVIPRPGAAGEEKIVRLNEAMCKGCGGCVAACPSGAMEQKGFKNRQVLAMIQAALTEDPLEIRNSKSETRNKSE
jgi:heterodisulfide reductase subunit A